jgi:hypothetical protein
MDAADIEAKAPVLAEFIKTSCVRNFARRPIGIGFSNVASRRQFYCWPILVYWQGDPVPPALRRSLTISRTAWSIR